MIEESQGAKFINVINSVYSWCKYTIIFMDFKLKDILKWLIQIHDFLSNLTRSTVLPMILKPVGMYQRINVHLIYLHFGLWVLHKQFTLELAVHHEIRNLD